MKRDAKKRIGSAVTAGSARIPGPPAQTLPTAPEKKYSLEDAFDYDPMDYVGDVVKGVLAVSYLLDSLSEIGNKNVDGLVAHGLSHALKNYAADAGAYFPPVQLPTEKKEEALRGKS